MHAFKGLLYSIILSYGAISSSQTPLSHNCLGHSTPCWVRGELDVCVWMYARGFDHGVSVSGKSSFLKSLLSTKAAHWAMRNRIIHMPHWYMQRQICPFRVFTVCPRRDVLIKSCFLFDVLTVAPPLPSSPLFFLFTWLVIFGSLCFI